MAKRRHAHKGKSKMTSVNTYGVPKPVTVDEKTTLRLRPHIATSAVSMINTPYIFLSPAAYSKMCQYIGRVGLEISWLGSVRELENNCYFIEDVHLFKQTVSAATTDIDEAGLNEFFAELLTRENGMELANKIRFWGHSHVNMATNPSGVDIDTMRQFGEQGHPWMIAGIGNKQGSLKFDIWYYQKGIKVTDVGWDIYYPLAVSDDEIKADITSLVSTKSYVYNPPYIAGSQVGVTQGGRAVTATWGKGNPVTQDDDMYAGFNNAGF